MAMDERQFEQVGGDQFGWYPDPVGALWLIRRFGIFGLGGQNGCNCCHFEVRGIAVHVSCHKSEHCVRVIPSGLGSMSPEVFEIAREVLSQLPENGYRVRFCDYSDDHVNGRWEDGIWREEYKCCYCGAPRFSADAYLCDACRTKPEARYYDASQFQGGQPA